MIGVSFDHMHMGDLLRMVAAHPEAEIAGVFDPDPARMAAAAEALAIPPERVFTDLDACIDAARPELAILCSAVADHGRDVARLAARGLSVLVEKPFAADAAEARGMIAAMAAGGGRLAINWPAAWSPGVVMAKRLIDAGEIGAPRELHYRGGNRGPLFHRAHRVEVSADEVEAEKPGSWWYSRARGGGSLRDYLGYGATVGTWLLGGAAPIEIACLTHAGPGIEVDEHAVVIARHAFGLSVLETLWGTLTDPWTEQPQPKCGYVVVGEAGSVSAYDHDPFVTVQTRARPAPRRVPAEPLAPGARDPVEYMLARLADGAPIEGPLDPALGLLGQRIIDTALRAAEARRALPLAP